MLYNYAYKLYLIYKLIIVYKEQGDIYEDNYQLVFNDDEYEDVINTFEKYISNGNSIFIPASNKNGYTFYYTSTQSYSDEYAYIHAL